MSYDSIVRVKQGQLGGKVLKSPGGKTFYGFLGVPYAKPPIGDLRFMPPVPAEPWQGIKDATKEGNQSMQLDMESGNIIGNEDSLFLNVYTPQIPPSGKKPLAVMVYIHGGAFNYGSGNADHHGPNFLIEEDVVFVSFNYRLGIFGFVNLNIPSLPGNAGLKDQTQVLIWIQENIEQFNGNPDNVTIFGESAGGASVEYHVLSPISKGLFHKAIAQSGSTLNPWAMRKDPVKAAFEVASCIGNHTKDLKELERFLREQSGEVLLKGTMDAPKELFTFKFVPSLETGLGSFISENPLNIFKKGEYNKVPYMSGTVDKEGLVFYLMDTVFSELKKNTNLLPMYPFEINEENKADLGTQLKTSYNYQSEQQSSEDVLVDFLTDAQFLSGVHAASKLIRKHQKDVYFYKFCHDGELNYLKKKTNLNKKGACHADEMGYLMHAETLAKTVPEADEIVRRRMIKMWTNFAKYGNPTPVIDEIITTNWKPVTETEFNHMIIGQNLTVSTDPVSNGLSIYEYLYS